MVTCLTDIEDYRKSNIVQSNEISVQNVPLINRNFQMTQHLLSSESLILIILEPAGSPDCRHHFSETSRQCLSKVTNEIVDAPGSTE